MHLNYRYDYDTIHVQFEWPPSGDPIMLGYMWVGCISYRAHVSQHSKLDDVVHHNRIPNTLS
jgi:hypothetical protein